MITIISIIVAVILGYMFISPLMSVDKAFADFERVGDKTKYPGPR